MSYNKYMLGYNWIYDETRGPRADFSLAFPEMQSDTESISDDSDIHVSSELHKSVIMIFRPIGDLINHIGKCHTLLDIFMSLT